MYANSKILKITKKFLMSKTILVSRIIECWVKKQNEINYILSICFHAITNILEGSILKY
jgi:hypothetical protein